MFGYQERPFSIIKSFETPVDQKNIVKQVFEIRETKNSEEQYISISGLDHEDSFVLDVLLKYENNKKGDLEKDWTLLITDINIEQEDLNAFQWIRNHHVGYNKNGSVILY